MLKKKQQAQSINLGFQIQVGRKIVKCYGKMIRQMRKRKINN
jgi:hypothetical protein